MPVSLTPRRAVLALGAVLLLSTAPAVYAYDATQPEADSSSMADTNGITHVTGGVGDDERDALEAARGDYNVHIVNSNKDGAYNDETQLTFTDKSGHEVLTADAGPLFFVELPAGSYTVVAQHGERQQQKKIMVGKTKKSPDIHFIW